MKVTSEFMVTVRNANVFDSFVKAESVFLRHEHILCSVSGGSDSDIVLDMMCRLDDDHKVTYAWFDTGMEYQATKDHISDLESKYGITIRRVKAIKPIPTSCIEYGQPFLSKYVSEMIERLQRHGFQWEDEPYESLVVKYPRAKSAIKWWCSWYDEDLAKSYPSQKGNTSKWSISRNKFLKEFMVKNPPYFPIAAKCCQYAKKDVSSRIEREINADLLVTGIRKAEGGVRAGAYSTCSSYDAHKGLDTYRPIFWYTQDDKDYYCKQFDVQHSKCYTEYGLKRTGCAGCPFNRKCVEELAIIEAHEPRLYKACTSIFKDSYDYTHKYREFVKKHT